MSLFPARYRLPVKITTDDWYMVRYPKLVCNGHEIESTNINADKNANGSFLMVKFNEEYVIVDAIVGYVYFISEANLWFTIKGWEINKDYCDDEYLTQLDDPETAREFEFYEVVWEVPYSIIRNLNMRPHIHVFLNNPELYFQEARRSSMKTMMKASKNR